jgi:hypothetical protein
MYMYIMSNFILTVNICSTEGSRGHVLVGMFNYRNQCLPPLSCEMEPCSWRGALDTLYDQVSQWLATGRWFSPGTRYIIWSSKSVTCDRSVVFSRYSIQHYGIKFVSDLRQVGGFLQVLDTTLYDKVCQWLATGRWFSPGTRYSIMW